MQKWKTYELVTTGSPEHPAFLRNGFNGFLRALPGDRALLSPSPRNAKHCRELTPASGRQDHTTSPSALVPLVLGHDNGHRIPPNVRDDGQRPSFRRDARSSRSDLPDGLSEIFFRAGLDTSATDLPVGQISQFSQPSTWPLQPRML